MEPDRQPTLMGELVTIRPSTPADWDALFAVASDPLVWEVHAGIASGGALTIIDKATGTVIGSSRYDNWVSESDEIEIGWTYLARAYWGGTYNREIKRLMLDHIHRFVGTVVFTVGETNHRSRGAMTKIGGVLREGVEYRLMAGEMKPHVIFEIRRP